MQRFGFLIVSVVLMALSARSFAQQPPPVLLDNASATVTRVHAPYTLHVDGKYGAFWVALGDSVLLGKRKLAAGEGEAVAYGSTLTFTASDLQRGNELIIIQVKKAFQPLSVSTLTLEPHTDVDDASDRNDSVLIALTDMQLRDQHTGDGEAWHPRKPRFVRLKRGDVLWLESGMHNIKNRLSNAITFAAVEW